MKHLVLVVFICLSFITNAQTRYVDKVFDSIASKTFTYSIRDKDTLKLDVYEPINDSIKNRPIIVFMHGGGFISGSRRSGSIIYMAEEVAKKGYVVASIDYRLLKNKFINCSFPADKKIKVFSNASEDLLNALLYLVNYKNSFKIDDRKIILFGASAGAETALNVVYSKDFLLKSLANNYKAIKPAAIISISGAIPKPEFITKNNAIPTILYHGVNDKVVPYDTSSHQSCLPTAPGFILLSGSKIIAEKLEANNTSFMLYSYLKRGHDIFNLPQDDFNQAFVFINKVVLHKKFFQARIVQ